MAVITLAAGAAATRHQLQYWQNSLTLFGHTVEVTPDNPFAQCNLGYSLSLSGEPSAAAVRYRVALAIDLRCRQAHFNLAGVLKSQEHWPEAAGHYLAVARLEADASPLHMGVAQVLPQLGLAQVLPHIGRYKDGAIHMGEFLQACPRSVLEAPNSPVHDQVVAALNNLAWPLATSGRAEDRDGARAVQFAERACELTQYSETVLVGTLAAAYAEAGRFPDAVATAEKACALATAANNQPLLKRNRQLLELYLANQPYHEPAAGSPPAVPAH